MPSITTIFQYPNSKDIHISKVPSTSADNLVFERHQDKFTIKDLSRGITLVDNRSFRRFANQAGQAFTTAAALEDYLNQILTAKIPTYEQLYFEGRVYVRTGRWYGLQPSYGNGYFNMNYNYGSRSYQQAVPNLTYNKSVGSRPQKDGILQEVIINFVRPSASIEKLHCFINKMSVKGNQVINQTLLHENTTQTGHAILANQAQQLILPINQAVSKQDVIQLFFNSSNTQSGTRYLYGTTIKFIYQ